MAKRNFLVIFLLLFCVSLAGSQNIHFIWSDFTSGELTPLLDGQVHFEKYYSGAKRLENFLPLPQGPAQRRTGFRYIGSTKNGPTETARLVPFVFSDEQAYVLEFGPLYIRFWRDDQQLFDTHADIKALIHPEDGIEGDASQSFEDDSAGDKAVTAGGNVQMDSMLPPEPIPQIGNLAIIFDGAGDFLSMGDSADWDISASDWTAAGWIRPDAGTDTPQTIWGQDSVADAAIDTTFVRLSLEKYTGLLLNGGDGNYVTAITDSSMNTKTLTRDGATSLLLHGIDSAHAETDNSQDFLDSSPTAHSIAVTGSVIIDDTDSQWGGTGIYFPAPSGHYLTVTGGGAHADFDFSGGNFVYEAWVKRSNFSAIHCLFEFYTDATHYARLTSSTSGNLAFSIANPGAAVSVFTGSGALTVNTWHHVVLAEDGNNWALFVDGARKATSSDTDRFQASYTSLELGRSQVVAQGYFGYMDDVSFVKASKYDPTSSTYIVPTRKLTAGETETADYKWATGSIGFSGQDYLTHTGSSDFDIGATGSAETFTVEMWVKADVILGTQYLFDLFEDADNYLRLFITGGGDVIAQHNADAGGAVTLTDGGGNISAGTWFHVAVVGDGINFSLYVKGTQYTATFDDTLNDMSADSLYIGADNAGANGYAGLIDDFKFSLNARYSGATLTVPTAEDKHVAHLKFEVSNAGSADDVESTDDTITTGDFHHWEVGEDTAPSGTTYLFSDGNLVDPGADGTVLTEDPGGALAGLFYIGIDVDGSSKDYDGWMDEFVFIKGQFLHSANFNVPTTTYNAILGTSAVEVTTTYTESDLFQLKFAQSADVLYISHPDFAPRKLERYSDVSWGLKTINFFPPPVKTKTVSPAYLLQLDLKTVGDSAGGARTFSDDGTGGTLFLAADVGREIREKPISGQGRALIKTWTDADNVECDIFAPFTHGLNGDEIPSGRWEMVGTSKTATLTLTTGTLEVGDVVVATASADSFEAADVGKYIEMVNDIGAGTDTQLIMAEIITFTSATAVVVVSLDEVTYDDAIIDADNWDMKENAWSGTEGAATDGNGYPSAVAFFENRLCWAGSYANLSTIWCSAVDDYENHLSGTGDGDSYNFTLSGPQVNRIVWMEPSDNLLIGTTGDEWVLGGRGAGEQVTPLNVSARVQSVYGSANVQPVGFGQIVLFLEKGGKKVRELSYDFDTDKYTAPDMSILAEHITGDGLTQLDFSITPFPVLWAVREDGVLTGLTYDRGQKIMAWHKHVTDGTFESIAVIPGDTQDELWAVINRTINGTTARYVEKMEDVFDASTLEDAFYVDSGKTYFFNPAGTSVTELSHLEGEIVQVLADGVVLGDETVSSGAITIDAAATDVQIGLPFTSYLQTMRPEFSQTGRGSSQGQKKRINRLTLRLKDAKQYKYGQTPSGTLMGYTHTSLFSGDTYPPLPFIQGSTQEGYVTIVQEEPLPITVIAIIPEINVP